MKTKIPGAAVSPIPSNARRITRDQLHQRTRELAAAAGRDQLQISQLDYEQARRELTGETDVDRQEALIDTLPESARWDPVPGSAGHQAPETPPEDEDEEGRSETEQEAESGVALAARQQAEEAARHPDK